MIKRYNQFVKGKLNEDYGMEAELESPVMSSPTSGITPPQTPTNLGSDEDFSGEEEEVATDKYEMALQSLADAAGVEFEPGQKSVVIDGKEITFPAETEKYHIKGVKKGFSTVEDVLANLGGQSNTPTDRSQETRDEMTSLKDETLLDNTEQFESKSYKSKRFKK